MDHVFTAPKGRRIVAQGFSPGFDVRPRPLDLSPNGATVSSATPGFRRPFGA